MVLRTLQTTESTKESWKKIIFRLNPAQLPQQHSPCGGRHLIYSICRESNMLFYLKCVMCVSIYLYVWPVGLFDIHFEYITYHSDCCCCYFCSGISISKLHIFITLLHGGIRGKRLLDHCSNIIRINHSGNNKTKLLRSIYSDLHYTYHIHSTHIVKRGGIESFLRNSRSTSYVVTNAIRMSFYDDINQSDWHINCMRILIKEHFMPFITVRTYHMTPSWMLFVLRTLNFANSSRSTSQICTTNLCKLILSWKLIISANRFPNRIPLNTRL